MALSIGMGVMKMGQSLMATNAQNKAAQAQTESANLAASYDYQQLTEERHEADEQAAQEKFQRQLQTQREHGRLMVATGEAGVGGNSTLRVLNNAILQGSYDESVIEANRLSKARQVRAKKDSVHATAQSRVNAAKASTISPMMGAMKAGLAGAKGGAQGYMMGKSLFKGKMMKPETTLQRYKRTGIH